MKPVSGIFASIAVAAALSFSLADASQARDRPEANCDAALGYLSAQFENDPRTRGALDLVLRGLMDMPAGYAYGGSSTNPWRVENSDALHRKMISMFGAWCTALPEIEGTSDNALDPILYFSWLFYRNDAGQDFVQGRDPANPAEPLEAGVKFLEMWGREYLKYMNSPESRGKVEEWIKDPRIEITDYKLTTARDYDSWNGFFARELKTDAGGSVPSRPVTMPDRDYVVVAPTDCIMNPLVQVLERDAVYERRFVENPLRFDTILDVKGIPLSMEQLLANTPDDLKGHFVGGTGLACVLMPNTYHHFHSPVDGEIVHAEIVEKGSNFATGTFGYIDFPNWVPDSGNVGGAGTDFSQFQAFERGIIVVEVRYRNLPGRSPEILTGYVASIPVGLDSVGSVVFDANVRKGARVTKGVTRFGNFYFGGSLDILLFSKGLVGGAVQTRMGNQISILNVGSAPRSPWSLDPAGGTESRR